MAITVPGSGSSATTSVTIPTHAVGDMIVIAARGTVAPTAPAAGGTVPTWTTPTNGSGVNNSVGWRIATTIATATNHTSGTWTSAAQMHVLILRRTGTNTLAVGDSPAQGGANNTQTMIYPAFTLTASKVSNLVIRYGARGTADTEVRTDGAFTTGGTWHTEQPATTPTSAVFSKVVTASEGTFTATPAGVNAAYRCGSLEITETAASVPHSQPVDDAIAGTDAQAKSVTSFKADAIAGVDAQAISVISPQADVATVTDAIDPQLTEGAFSPADIAGLYAWYDADALGLANNDPVTSWTDESGGARHATGAVAPLYKTGIQNGLPGLLFDGTDDTLAMTFSADTSRTFFVVAESLVSTAGIRAVIGGSASRSLVQVSGAWVWRTNQAGTGASLGGTSTNTTVLSGVLTDATSMSWYLDTGSATSFDPDNTVTTGTGWTIGSYAAGQFWSGYIFEVVVYDSALGTTDRESVRDYLISKWQGAPVGHSQPVDDAIAGTDAQAKAVASTKADAVAGTDAQAKSVTSPKADAIAGTDAATRRVTAAKADAITGIDARTVTWTAARSQPDAIAGTDAQAKATTRPQADTATVTDATARVWAAKLTIADGISATDAIDTSAAGANERDIDDAASVTDAVARSTQTVRAPADAIVGTDAQAKRVTRPQTDAITGTDARTRVWAAKLTLADGLAVTDDIDASTAGANEEEIDDSATVTDAVTVSLGIGRTIGDSLAATDALASQVDYIRQPADALQAVDVVARAWAIIETQADGLAVTDVINARIPPSRWLPDTDEDWPADTDEDWEAQTDDRWLVSAESKW